MAIDLLVEQGEDFKNAVELSFGSFGQNVHVPLEILIHAGRLYYGSNGAAVRFSDAVPPRQSAEAEVGDEDRHHIRERRQNDASPFSSMIQLDQTFRGRQDSRRIGVKMHAQVAKSPASMRVSA
jgi:hypothetical protein